METACMKVLPVSLTSGGQSLLSYAFLKLTHTPWGFLTMDKSESTKSNVDAYGKNNFFEHLDYMKNPTVYGTEYDVILLCEFLKISIETFSSSSISFLNGYMDCPPPLSFGMNFTLKITLWHENEHYEPVHFFKFPLPFF
jgi:hypothetical protein